ncbi:hypothetical protein AAE02nite_45480 [Adhaeribacter aerolatus]|uniref:Uncharacterized protein n=1 Tax=Adhaeribacter aerolatus TaxID=670289 RepID=A0A512B4I0_9BACT|nr:hypothetical protein [Adhaeribacter aerolatus]GEO06884.1 hypothetical protein AAE02nite_45480 [Adhaeribacter aerolatus]
MAISEENQENTPAKSANIYDKDYREQTNGNQPDPSAKRNVGRGGETERPGQKDKLENLHIGGNEVSGYGANDPEEVESTAQGPGFEFEGSYEEGDGTVNGVRSTDQPLDSDTTEPNENASGYNRI